VKAPDFTVIRFLMKLFKSANRDLMTVYCTLKCTLNIDYLIVN